MPTVKITIELEKPLYDAICEYIKKYPYYEDAADFIVEGTRRHMENVYALVKARH
jgi:hypothetical protein